MEENASFEPKLSLESLRSLLDTPMYLDSFCLACTGGRLFSQTCSGYTRQDCSLLLYQQFDCVTKYGHLQMSFAMYLSVAASEILFSVCMCSRGTPGLIDKAD